MDWNTIGIILLVFITGCFGGYVSWLLPKPEPREGQSTLRLWYKGKDCETSFPGLITNIFAGGLAASAVWCLYGPYSGEVLVGPDAGVNAVNLTVGQLPISFFIGMGGLRYLLAEAQRRCAQYQVDLAKKGIKGINYDKSDEMVNK